MNKSLVHIQMCLVLLFGAVLFSDALADSIPDVKLEKMTVLEPRNNSMFEGELIDIVIKVNDYSFDTIVVTNNKSEIWRSPVIKGKGVFCKTIELRYGPNELTINAVKGDSIVESKKISTFYRTDISLEHRKTPPGFDKNYFHKAGNESSCHPCHKTDISEKDFKPLKPENSMCHQCHRKIALYSYVHGPTSRGDCLKCHDKESKPVKYATLKPDRDLCFICHTEKKEEWAPKQYMHGPTATGKCTICHNPHASNNLYWLKKPSWDLCIACHEDRGSGTHIVIGFSPGSTHPTKGRPDPIKYGKELACASCHNPHSSNSKSLFPNDAQSFDGLCLMCHKM